MEKRCSIIITTYNKAAFLNITLAAYSIQSYKDFEIILVNDGSTDNTEDVIAFYSGVLDIISIKNEINLGRAESRNKALLRANNHIIIIADDDRIPDINFVKTYIEKLECERDCVLIGNKYWLYSIINEEVPSIDMLCNKAKQLSESGRMEKLSYDMQMFTVEEMMSDFAGTINKYVVEKCEDNYDDVFDRYGIKLEGFLMPWGVATTGNMAFYRKDDMKATFDSRYKGWGVEDTDFCYQLSLEGYRFEFCEDAINYHQNHMRADNELYSLKRNIRFFCDKYDNIATYLFAMTFCGKDTRKEEMHLIDVNELLKKYYLLAEEDELRKYIYFCYKNWHDFKVLG